MVGVRAGAEIQEVGREQRLQTGNQTLQTRAVRTVFKSYPSSHPQTTITGSGASRNFRMQVNPLCYLSFLSTSHRGKCGDNQTSRGELKGKKDRKHHRRPGGVERRHSSLTPLYLWAGWCRPFLPPTGALAPPPSCASDPCQLLC